jgi:hypothetical protein
MAKRFRDTEIWAKPWFRKMPPVLKCAWDYLLDRCDAVGVWVPDFEAAEFHIGEGVDWEALRAAAGWNIETLSNGKWVVSDFCAFQYGELREGCIPHRSYLSLLRKHGIKGYPKGIHTLQEKEKELDKEKEKDKEATCLYAEGVSMRPSEYSALVGQYGERVVKLAIEKVSAQQIKTGKKYKSARGAILQWGIRSALEDAKKVGGIDRTPPANPVCPSCGKAMERDHGYWACADHGRQETA